MLGAVDRMKRSTFSSEVHCYADRNPDLKDVFCDAKNGCDVKALQNHYETHGRTEGRRYGCAPDALYFHQADGNFVSRIEEDVGGARMKTIHEMLFFHL